MRESQLQRFFEDHPHFLLGTDYQGLRSGIVLPNDNGPDLVPDFFLEPIAGRHWDIAELKLPNNILTAGRPSRQRYSHYVYDAVAQLRTYAHYFDDPACRDKVYRRYGILAYKPKVSVIIGRKPELDDLVLRQIEYDLPWVRVVTYDELLEKARTRLIG